MISRTLTVSERVFPWRTRITILMLGAAVLSAGYQLSDVAVGVDTNLVRTFALIAIGLGWLMAARATSVWVALLASALVGIAVLTVRIGNIGAGLVAVPEEFFSWRYQSLRLGEHASADALIAAASELATDLGVLYSRLWLWLRTLATGQLGVDPVASAFMWSALIWFAALWGAWVVRRRNRPIVAVVPILTLLGIAYLVSRGPSTAFVLPLWCALLLTAFASHDSRVRGWLLTGVDSPQGKTASLAIIVVPIAILLTAAAAWAQSISIGKVVSAVETIAGNRARVESDRADTLGLDRGGGSETGLEPLFAPGLPNRHLIGSGEELSEIAVMEVVVTNLPTEGPVPGLRWRSISYDQYLGRGWRTSDLFLTDHEPGEPTREAAATSSLIVRQSVREIEDRGRRVYSAGLPIVLDQPTQVAWRRVGEDAFAFTTEAQPYQVESIISRASESELRAAGTDYPGWVLETYLPLPGDLPDRVLALARDLTATSATPYDRALAIETYLRTFPYNLDVSTPPRGWDVVDYFLFDLHEGYCDYFASSMVVLARAAGVPARLVVGYASGTPSRSEGTTRFLVSEAEAHSWVEVYFPGIGWIEFEPTSGRAAIQRAAVSIEETAPETPSFELADRTPFTFEIGEAIWAVLVAPLVAWLGWILLVDPIRLKRQSPQQALRKLYLRLRSHAHSLDIDSFPGDTPFELQAAIARSSFVHLMQQTGRLIEAYVGVTYANAPGDSGLVREQIRAWRGLSARMWLARIRRAGDSLGTPKNHA